MNVTRRNLLIGGAVASAGIGCLSAPGMFRWGHGNGLLTPVAHSIVPVISDQVWIWKDQPKDAKGPVDQREFEVSIGVRWRSDGTVRNLLSSTVAPVEFPEQKISKVEIVKSERCQARLVPLSDSAGQLQVAAPLMERGQEIEAKAVYRVKLARFCPNYSIDQFPKQQTVREPIKTRYLGNSPGIRSDLSSLARISQETASRHEHPWEKAHKFYQWVWDNIEGKPGKYSSVRAALESRIGDCEERAGVFVALCRGVGIPARLVLVPNHCWAEFCLYDHDGKPHWIPAHTAAYNWFGWTGAHELVLQKGDRIRMPGKDATVRLVQDWYSFRGRKPAIEFFGQLKPVSDKGEDPGPGKRTKNRNGGWDLAGDHKDDRRLRGS